MPPNSVAAPSFFDGRYLVEIASWDWEFHLGLSPRSVPKKHRFQGGLVYARGLTIEGTVLAPARNRAIRVWFSPVGPNISFGRGGLNRVGWLTEQSGPPAQTDFEATLYFPEDALAPFVSCLSSVWRYIHIWVDGDPHERAAVRDFSLSRELHSNLLTWAGERPAQE